MLYSKNVTFRSNHKCYVMFYLKMKNTSETKKRNNLEWYYLSFA